MPDIADIRAEIAERRAQIAIAIAALHDEDATLAAMTSATGGAPEISPALKQSAAPKPAAPKRGRPRAKATAAGRRPSRRQTSTGGRAAQAAALIVAQPGITAAELAEAMGMKRNYLYRVLPALEKAGQIKKNGSGYHPVPATAG